MCEGWDIIPTKLPLLVKVSHKYQRQQDAKYSWLTRNVTNSMSDLIMTEVGIVITNNLFMLPNIMAYSYWIRRNGGRHQLFSNSNCTISGYWPNRFLKLCVTQEKYHITDNAIATELFQWRMLIHFHPYILKRMSLMSRFAHNKQQKETTLGLFVTKPLSAPNRAYCSLSNWNTNVYFE